MRSSESTSVKARPDDQHAERVQATQVFAHRLFLEFQQIRYAMIGGWCQQCVWIDPAFVRVLLCAAALATIEAHSEPERHPEHELVYLTAPSRIVVHESGETRALVRMGMRALSERARYELGILITSHCSGVRGSFVSFFTKEGLLNGSQSEGPVELYLGTNVLVPGPYTLLTEIRDDYPGLAEEDSLLASQSFEYVHITQTCVPRTRAPVQEGHAEAEDAPSNMPAGDHPTVSVQGAQLFRFCHPQALPAFDPVHRDPGVVPGLCEVYVKGNLDALEMLDPDENAAPAQQVDWPGWWFFFTRLAGVLPGLEYTVVIGLSSGHGHEQYFVQNFSRPISDEDAGGTTITMPISFRIPPGEAGTFMCAADQCPDQKEGAVRVVVYVLEILPSASTAIMPKKTKHDLDLNRAAAAEEEERAEVKQEREMLDSIPLDIPHYRSVLSKKQMVLQRARHADDLEKADEGGWAEGRWDGDESWWKGLILEAYRGAAHASFEANVPAIARKQVGGQKWGWREGLVVGEVGEVGEQGWREETATESRGTDDEGEDAGGWGGRGEGENGHGVCDSVWDTTVVIMTHGPSNSSRVLTTRRVLGALGFRKIRVPRTIGFAEIDEQLLRSQGVFTSSLFSRMRERKDTDAEGLMRYGALSLSFVEQLRLAAASLEPVLMIEDDLMLAAPLEQVRERICAALSHIPPAADLVYLEYCFETCSKVTHRQMHGHLAKAYHPSCEAAIYFTGAGAARAVGLMEPVFDVVDRMLPALISRGWLQAWLMTPPAFFQDQAFRSNFKRERRPWNHGQDVCSLHPESSHLCHQPAFHTPLCWEVARTHLPFIAELQELDQRQVGVLVPGEMLPHFLSAATQAFGIAPHGTPDTPSGREDEFGEEELSVSAEEEEGKEESMFLWLRYGMLGPRWLAAAAPSYSSSSAPLKLVGARIQYSTAHVSSSNRDTQGGHRGGRRENETQQVMVGTWLLPELRFVTSRVGGQEQEQEQKREHERVVVEEGEVYMEWTGMVEEAGVLLEMGRDSACFHLTDVETCLIQCTLLSHADELLATQTFRVFLRIWPLYRNPLNRQSLPLPPPGFEPEFRNFPQPLQSGDETCDERVAPETEARPWLGKAPT